MLCQLLFIRTKKQTKCPLGDSAQCGQATEWILSLLHIYEDYIITVEKDVILSMKTQIIYTVSL